MTQDTTVSALLLNDIDISGEENWTPMGTHGNDYAGTFDGGGHKITGLKTSNADYVGLFRYIANNGTVKNLTVEGADITASRTIGIIAGGNGGTIENCTVSGKVTATGWRAHACGGIAGNNNSGTIRNCRSGAEINASGADNYDIGGIAGDNFYGTVTGCLNSGVVNGNSDVGGIMGNNSYSTVTGCLNSGAVNGTNNVGGIVGNRDNISGTVTNCAWLADTATNAFGDGSDGDVTVITSENDLSSAAITLTAEIDRSSINPNVATTDEAYSATISLTSAPGTHRDAVTNINYDIDDAGQSIVSVAKNDDGTFTVTPATPAQPGTAVITVTADLYTYDFSEKEYDNTSDPTPYEFTITVTVSDITLDSISLLKKELTLNIDETETLTVTYEPTNATNKTVTWKSDDESIAKVESTVEGKATVTAVSAGKTTITATSEDGSHTANCIVTVNPMLVESIEITQADGTPIENLALETEREYTFKANVQPENATDKGVTWTVTGAEKYVDNEDGTVTITTGNQKGYVTITATAQDGSGVTNANPPLTLDVIIPNVESVTVTPDTATITNGVGGTATLTASILPTNAQYGEVEWTSSNEAVATVKASDGDSTTATVTAAGAGTATITATAGGKSNTCEITVAEVQADSVTIDETQREITLTAGGEKTLSAVLAPPNSTDKITWTSSDPSIATVDENGKITAHKSGTVTITATATSGAATPITLTVTAAEPPAEEEPEEPATPETPETPATPQQPSSGGGGGGCSAGFGALALLALAPMMLRRKK